MFESTQKRLVRELLADSELAQRVERLMTIPAVGEITALTWAGCPVLALFARAGMMLPIRFRYEVISCATVIAVSKRKTAR
jgi:hypothetical protein